MNYATANTTTAIFVLEDGSRFTTTIEISTLRYRSRWDAMTTVLRSLYDGAKLQNNSNIKSLVIVDGTEVYAYNANEAMEVLS